MSLASDFGEHNDFPTATYPAVHPIGGECHNAPGEIVREDGSLNSGIATANLVGDPTSVIEDNANVPLDVSLEWAADINILRLHDQKHGTSLYLGTTMDGGGIPFKAVVCQTCHYTPALDLAQLGPRGPETDAPLVLNGVEISPSIANGADQIKHRSMSNVMHKHHGALTDASGDLLFPEMPPAVNADGSLRDPLLASVSAP